MQAGTSAPNSGAVGARPTLIIIGAMKCGTTAVHRALSHHPHMAMSDPKELNFFFGPAHVDPDTPDPPWAAGNLWRGLDWYAGHFPATAAVRGEASPGYTSPDHPEVAGRMAHLVPNAGLVYLVRDPVARALSQYRHHVRDGSEHRQAAEALTDPGSQYIARSRYHERLLPFLEHFSHEQILIVAQEDLRAEPRRTLRRVCRFGGADPDLLPSDAIHRAPPQMRAPVDGSLHAALAAAVRDDTARLRALVDRPLPAWSV
ncbi:MAG TPA: sulfotransferase [Euzebyales bacterium]